MADHNGNLLESDQHTDLDHGEFFMRCEIDRDGFNLDRDSFPSVWEPLARRFDMRWSIYWGDSVKRMVILVGKRSHCLSDLLWRYKAGELEADVPLIISNHPDCAGLARDAGIPFEVCPITPQTKAKQESRVLDLLADIKPDFVVLARYMQILSAKFVSHYPNRILNIHHSFLPAFTGASPYQQAYSHGVKMIGATCHYVTADLDRGPIITQDATPTSHRDTVEDLVRKGSDLERVVLARAVRLHLNDNILVSQNKTIVFE